MVKIVFFVMGFSSIHNKRIEDFKQHGYNVDVYSFGKDKYFHLDDSVNLFDIDYLSMSYVKRCFYFTINIYKIISKYNKNNTIFYFTSLNVAICALLIPKLKYIFEECDLLFDRVSNVVLKQVIKKIDLTIINKSIKTVFTSRGFAYYYYGDKVPPMNIEFIPNKLNVRCQSLPRVDKHKIDFNHLSFAFVGYIRYNTIYNFAKCLKSNFPQYKFDFYGSCQSWSIERINELKRLGCKFMGPFDNPIDLPKIYSNIDIIVCTYDIKGINPKYAEPNKIYESIYFRVPIVVSSNCYLADTVTKKHIGFSVDPYNEDDMIEKIQNLTINKYNEYCYALSNIPQSYAIDNNDSFFLRLKEYLVDI